VTNYDYLSISLLILAIGVNSALVWLQKTRQIYQRFGKRAHGVHGSLISVFWGAFIISEFVDNSSTWRLPHAYPIAGLTLMAGALLLFGLALQQIGWDALSNGNFFGKPMRKLGGVYRYIREPIYWSYAVWFAGIGLVTSLKAFFIYTLISIIGLVGVESWVERPIVTRK
jgi:protein-S-isoprenylcysteine O-methyltransferase Ste14